MKSRIFSLFFFLLAILMVSNYAQFASAEWEYKDKVETKTDTIEIPLTLNATNSEVNSRYNASVTFPVDEEIISDDSSDYAMSTNNSCILARNAVLNAKTPFSNKSTYVNEINECDYLGNETFEEISPENYPNVFSYDSTNGMVASVVSEGGHNDIVGSNEDGGNQNYKGLGAIDWGTSGIPIGFSSYAGPESGSGVISNYASHLYPLKTVSSALSYKGYQKTISSISQYYSIWLRTDAVGLTNRTLFAITNSTLATSARLFIVNSLLYYTSSTDISICSILANTWYHLCFFFNSTSKLFNVWINGNRVLSTTILTTSIPSILRCESYNNIAYFDACSITSEFSESFKSLYAANKTFAFNYEFNNPLEIGSIEFWMKHETSSPLTSANITFELMDENYDGIFLMESATQMRYYDDNQSILINNDNYDSETWNYYEFTWNINYGWNITRNGILLFNSLGFFGNPLNLSYIKFVSNNKVLFYLDSIDVSDSLNYFYNRILLTANNPFEIFSCGLLYSSGNMSINYNVFYYDFDDIIEMPINQSGWIGFTIEMLFLSGLDIVFQLNTTMWNGTVISSQNITFNDWWFDLTLDSIDVINYDDSNSEIYAVDSNVILSITNLTSFALLQYPFKFSSFQMMIDESFLVYWNLFSDSDLYTNYYYVHNRDNDVRVSSGAKFDLENASAIFLTNWFVNYSVYEYMNYNSLNYLLFNCYQNANISFLTENVDFYYNITSTNVSMSIIFTDILILELNIERGNITEFQISYGHSKHNADTMMFYLRFGNDLMYYFSYDYGIPLYDLGNNNVDFVYVNNTGVIAIIDINIVLGMEYYLDEDNFVEGIWYSALPPSFAFLLYDRLYEFNYQVSDVYEFSILKYFVGLSDCHAITNPTLPVGGYYGQTCTLTKWYISYWNVQKFTSKLWSGYGSNLYTNTIIDSTVVVNNPQLASNAYNVKSIIKDFPKIDEFEILLNYTNSLFVSQISIVVKIIVEYEIFERYLGFETGASEYGSTIITNLLYLVYYIPIILIFPYVFGSKFGAKGAIFGLVFSIIILYLTDEFTILQVIIAIVMLIAAIKTYKEGHSID